MDKFNESQKITIEKDIPRERWGWRKYPFGEMEVGDSFELAGVRPITLSNAATSYAKHHNKKFSVRTTAVGCRVWRIA